MTNKLCCVLNSVGYCYKCNNLVPCKGCLQPEAYTGTCHDCKAIWCPKCYADRRIQQDCCRELADRSARYGNTGNRWTWECYRE